MKANWFVYVVLSIFLAACSSDNQARTEPVNQSPGNGSDGDSDGDSDSDTDTDNDSDGDTDTDSDSDGDDDDDDDNDDNDDNDVDSGTPSETDEPKDTGDSDEVPEGEFERFSFFLTSLKAMRRLSKNQKGFGGDLRYGEETGLEGADKICTEIAETAMPGSGKKVWRAFLSASEGPRGGPVHAKDRIGKGPWYDRRQRLVAKNLEDLLQVRPRGADPIIKNDLPNEDGVPNHAPEGKMVNNHHVLTGTNAKGEYTGKLAGTCQDWTAKKAGDGKPRVGLSFPRSIGGSGGAMQKHWYSDMNEFGCAPCVTLVNATPTNLCVGASGGYGGIYCFALVP